MIENTQNSFEMNIGFFIFYIIFINYIIFMCQILSFWLIGSKAQLCRGKYGWKSCWLGTQDTDYKLFVRGMPTFFEIFPIAFIDKTNCWKYSIEQVDVAVDLYGETMFYQIGQTLPFLAASPVLLRD